MLHEVGGNFEGLCKPIQIYPLFLLAERRDIRILSVLQHPGRRPGPLTGSSMATSRIACCPRRLSKWENLF